MKRRVQRNAHGECNKEERVKIWRGEVKRREESEEANEASSGKPGTEA